MPDDPDPNCQCARWLNVTYNQLNDIESCIAAHPEITGPGCTGCKDYPKEWE